MAIENINTLKGLITKANEVIEVSKKLTTKQRKKMKESTFCGKGRSFPVPDCAHYTAALRLLNRSKFSAEEKTKIKKCILNKGIKLNCKNAKENKKENSSYLTIDMQALYDSKEFATTKQLIEASIKNPDKSLSFYLTELFSQGSTIDINCMDIDL